MGFYSLKRGMMAMKNVYRRSVIFLITFFAATLSFATENTCYQNLTDDHQRDTYYAEVNLDRYSLRDYGPDHLAHAIQIVRAFVSEVGCRRDDINFARTPIGSSRSRCQNLSEDRLRTSLSCYVESNLGRFWVHYGYFNTAQVIYYRWD
jgi:hypothetical protein